MTSRSQSLHRLYYLWWHFEIARITKHRLGRGLSNLAQAEKDLGNYSRAEELILESLDMARNEQKIDRVISTLNFLGELKLATKEFSEAEAFLEEALNLARKIGYRELGTVHPIAYLAFEQGDYELAFNHTQALLKMSQESGNSDLENSAYALLGRLATARGDYAHAQISFQTCLRRAWSSGARLIMHAIIGVAELLEQQNKDKKAILLLSLATTHSFTQYSDKEWAHRLLDKLESHVPTEVFIAAAKRGKTIKLNSVMEEILGDVLTL